MNRPVPKIRTETESAQVNPVLDSSRTSGQPPMDDPVPTLPPQEWGQGGQGASGTGPDGEPVDPRLDAARAQRAAKRAVRSAFEAARQAGIARRHAARLRHHAETRWRAESEGPTND